MAYVFNADIYCDRCGRQILSDLDKPTWDAIGLLNNAIATLEESDDADCMQDGKSPIDLLSAAIDHLTFPSDETDPALMQYVPVWADDNEESDSPQHCASGEDCLDALTLSDGRKVGHLFGSLTSEGYDYVREAIEENPNDPLMLEWAAHFEIRVLYRLELASYCGMGFEIAESDDSEDARSEAADYLRSMRRKGFPIATLKRGEKWEILEPESAQMVPDECGILSLDLEVK